MIPFLIVFVVAFLVSLTLTPFCGDLGERLNIVDRPGGRRDHAAPTSRLGGIALYVALVLATVVSLFIPPDWLPPSPEGPDPKEIVRFTALIVGSTFIFIVGLIDDKYQLRAGVLFALQFVAALIAIAGLIFIERVNSPFTNELVIFPWYVIVSLTVFWIMGMINTVNWLDGLDGLAAGVVAIAAAVFTIHMWRAGQYSVVFLPLALLGATLGFLPHNFLGRIFMGSSGALLLGFTLAALSIIAGAKVATALLVLCIPILDVAWLMVYRLYGGRSFAQAGRDHLHFRLLEMGIPQRTVVLIYYFASICLGALALLISSRLYKLLALLILGLGAFVFLVLVARRTGKT
jgi:UDP-GlcNAc:undecaprenyl-phosphate GlcNAc-1-phosphate transferase